MAGRRHDLWDDDEFETSTSSGTDAPEEPAADAGAATPGTGDAPEAATAEEQAASPEPADSEASGAEAADGKPSDSEATDGASSDTSTAAAAAPAGAATTSAEDPDQPDHRSGRHGRRGQSRFPGWAVLVAMALVLLLCVGGAFAALRGGGDDSACGGDPITVSAAPEIAQPLKEALSKVEEEDDCADFEVSAASSASAAADINDGDAPDVWIPDSSTWIDSIDSSETSGQWLEGQSIATSPIALATGPESKGGTSEVSSWTRLLNEEGALEMADPDSDTASRLAFHASRVDQPGRIGLETGKRLIFMSRFAAPSQNKLFDDYEADPSETSPFPASEQRIASFNEDDPEQEPLEAVFPEKGTLSLDYPWITNPELSGDVLKAADRARTELGTLEIRDSLAEAGFRDASGQGGPETDGEPAPEVTELEAPDRDERVAAVEQWEVMRTDMRMLALIDASGSMKWDSPTEGQSRWDVTQGSLLKGVDMLPAGSQVGGWMFTAEEGSDTNHQELAPVQSLDTTVGSGTHRDRVTKLIEDGDSRLGGDTPLYDAVWDAHQKMVKDYDPEYVNSIVVFTDGVNDNPNGGLTLKQLLAKLDDAYDPKRPVRVITIGMGEADADALQQISDETGGTSYIAETPDDIERVFVQSLLARSSG